MSFKKFNLMGVMALCGLLSIMRPAQAYLIPIASVEENAIPNLMLLVESEITRWKQEALKYQEMIYTDLVGKVGGGSLGENNVVEQLKEAAKDGSAVIGNTTVKLDKISDLGDYSKAKEEIEKHYMIQSVIGKFYPTGLVKEIQERQRVALNDLTVGAITQGAVDVVGAIVSRGDSDPKSRAKDIAKAKDLNAMAEMLLAMDRRAYERSLQTSALEAADAGVRAMSVLKGLSETATRTSGVPEE